MSKCSFGCRIRLIFGELVDPCNRALISYRQLLLGKQQALEKLLIQILRPVSCEAIPSNNFHHEKHHGLRRKAAVAARPRTRRLRRCTRRRTGPGLCRIPGRSAAVAGEISARVQGPYMKAQRHSIVLDFPRG